MTGEYAYVYVDGIYLKRSWGGEVQNVSVLVAIGVSTDGYREIIGAAEGMKEDFESWHNSFIWLKERGLTGVRLIVGDKCLGMLESIADVFPEAKYQRCTVCWNPLPMYFRKRNISAAQYISIGMFSA